MITYNKLVRDKIIEKIESTWGTAHYHLANEAEFEQKLKEKLIEEAQELSKAKNLDEIQWELADVLKITQEIMNYYHINEDEINELIKQKDEKAGGFEKRIILDEASVY